jgi:glycosyltransferase involved in cell wall biosynthesis
MVIMQSITKQKLKILVVSEASFLSSGFAIYTREILSRLHQTNKYNIAELASYGTVNDPRDKSIPWRYYANAVNENDPRHAEYSSRGDNQFGRWRFEKVLLDFRPDVVIDFRDYWMSAYQGLSPLRKYFHWILMPTVDSAPQQEEWIDTFISADSIFTYSDWGAKILKEQSSGKINYINTVSPGVDLSTFRIYSDQEKLGIRDGLGISRDSIVFGSVMRNQKRKLIPELIKSFRQAIDQLESTDPNLSSKLYLYLHTSYPDAGWDIPELLKDNRLSNRVFFTYSCKSCGFVKPNIYAGPVSICPRCFSRAMSFTSVSNGIASEHLSAIYNTFDAYIQYSICEGFGCPQTEAGACGVPIMTVNYSAMCDIVEKLEAVAIQPSSYFKELETKAIRVYPDNNQLCEEIIKLAKMSPDERKSIGHKTRRLTEKHYNWNDIANKWEHYLDHLDDTYRSDWSVPPKFLSLTDTSSPVGNSQHIDYIKNICNNNLQDQSFMGSMNMLSLLQQADYGFSMQGTNISKHTYEDISNFVNVMIDNWNQSEQARYNNTKFDDDFIQYANIKDQTR